MSRLLGGNFIFLQDLTNNGELDNRYAQKNNSTGFNEYIKDTDIVNLNQYVKINEEISTPNFNNGANVSGANFIVNNTALFKTGILISGKLIINDKEILINADGGLYSPSRAIG